jgi:DNA-binding NtrC family response regulator
MIPVPESAENHFVLPGSDGHHSLIGSSPRMRTLRAFIDRFALNDSPILITGESGTGKESAARRIHQLSARRTGPFIKVNCGTIPEPMLEIELFGYVRGALAGAVDGRQGSLHDAHGGTLLFDEIGELSPKLQLHVLRVLRERRFQPLGSAQSVDADVRMIAATTGDLRSALRQHKFREELFYALTVLSLDMPPLRERDGDVPLLVRHFSELHARRHARAAIEIDGSAMAALENYSWPGNVRELENLIERLVLLTDKGPITRADLPGYMDPDRLSRLHDASEITLPGEGIDLDAILAVIENSFITQALQRTGGNKTEAAELLKLNRTTFFHRLRKKGMLSSRRAVR